MLWWHSSTVQQPCEWNYHEHQTGGWKDDVCFLFSDREQRETSCSSRERFIMLAVLLYGLGSPLLALAIGLVLFWPFVDLLDFCNLAHCAAEYTKGTIGSVFAAILINLSAQKLWYLDLKIIQRETLQQFENSIIPNPCPQRCFKWYTAVVTSPLTSKDQHGGYTGASSLHIFKTKRTTVTFGWHYQFFLCT